MVAVENTTQLLNLSAFYGVEHEAKNNIEHIEVATSRRSHLRSKETTNLL